MNDFSDNLAATIEVGPNTAGYMSTSITVKAAEPIFPDDATESPYVDLDIEVKTEHLTVTTHGDLTIADADDLIDALTAARDRAIEWAEARGWGVSSEADHS